MTDFKITVSIDGADVDAIMQKLTKEVKKRVTEKYIEELEEYFDKMIKKSIAETEQKFDKVLVQGMTYEYLMNRMRQDIRSTVHDFACKNWYKVNADDVINLNHLESKILTSGMLTKLLADKDFVEEIKNVSARELADQVGRRKGYSDIFTRTEKILEEEAQ